MFILGFCTRFESVRSGLRRPSPHACTVGHTAIFIVNVALMAAPCVDCFFGEMKSKAGYVYCQACSQVLKFGGAKYILKG